MNFSNLCVCGWGLPSPHILICQCGSLFFEILPAFRLKKFGLSEARWVVKKLSFFDCHLLAASHLGFRPSLEQTDLLSDTHRALVGRLKSNGFFRNNSPGTLPEELLWPLLFMFLSGVDHKTLAPTQLTTCVRANSHLVFLRSD